MKIRNLRSICVLCISLISYLSFIGCSDKSTNEENGEYGFAPQSVIGKTLVLEIGGSKVLSATHTSETILKLNSSSADYSYPPSYEYSVDGINQASYYIDFTLKTYLNSGYIYYNRVFDIEMEFTSLTAGTFTGTTMKDAKISNVNGTFTLRTAGDKDEEFEEDDDTEDDPQSQMKISVSKCSFSEITANSAKVSGKITLEGEGKISERGFVWSKQQNPTVGNEMNVISKNTLNTLVNETIASLDSDTYYYVRQYVISNSKIIYGENSQFKTEKGSNPNPDEDNTDYSIVPIIQWVYPNKVQIAGKYTYFVTNNKFKNVGYCVSKSPHPIVVDITIPETILKNEPFGREVKDLEEGTTYYVRPFYRDGNKIIYCTETSFQTVGKDIKLTAMVSPQRDKIEVNYSVVPKGTYHLKLRYTSTITTNPEYVNNPDLGFVSEGSGSKEANVKLIWGYIKNYRAILEDLETRRCYCSDTHSGD